MARIETSATAARSWVAERASAPWRLVLSIFLRIVAVAHLGWALWEWAALIGFVPPVMGVDPKAHLPRQGAAFFFTGVDPIAAVGLWLGSTWGAATWLVATFARILIHTAYAGIFDWTPVWTAVQAASILIYLTLFFLSERAEREEKLKRRRRPE
ncbi:MAG: DUF6163 family protein [Hyphomicrobiales bacterium]|nr:DUF6163 family protein [Hyphomicrobiales bacterium]